MGANASGWDASSMDGRRGKGTEIIYNYINIPVGMPGREVVVCVCSLCSLAEREGESDKII